MKQLAFTAISILAGIVLGLALIEGASIAWLRIEDGQYTAAAELFEHMQNIYARESKEGFPCRYVDTLFPHPYLGFVHSGNPPCGLPNVNNIGLMGEDFPGAKRTDRYTILLAGGSVASQLGQIAPPPAPRYLEEELNARYASPTGKPFLVLNGGDGAWKQPQQFILFSMYASSIDAVVTLDGFNEHYFFRDWPIAERLERPLSNFVEVNPYVEDENFGDAAVEWTFGRIAERLVSIPMLGQSHAAYLIVHNLEVLAKRGNRTAGPKRTTLNGLFALPPGTAGDPKRVFAYELAVYQKYVLYMEAIAHEQGVKSAYFLQPVPAIGKTLTDEELRGAGDLGYRDIYLRIVAGMLTLRDRGVPIFDLGDVFATETGTIYADSIHLAGLGRPDSRGNRLLAARVARELAAAWGLQPRGQ